MREIQIDPVANQTVTVYLENDRYDLTFKQAASGATLATIMRNDDLLVSNILCVAGTPLLPFVYVEKGNFIFSMANEGMPLWQDFGTTTFLFYMSEEEVGVARAG